MRLHLSIGCYDCRRTSRHRQSIHFSRIQVFLLTMCIDAPESTRNSLSSSFRFDGAGRHLFSGDEKNVALWCSFNFNTLVASFHAASRAHRSRHSVSSWDRSSNFGALGLRLWGSPGQIFPSEGFWSRMSPWRTTASVNSTHRVSASLSWSKQVSLFLQWCFRIQASHVCRFPHHSNWMVAHAKQVSLFLQLDFWFLVEFVGSLHYLQQLLNPILSSNCLWRKSSEEVEVTHVLSRIWFLQFPSW